MVRATSTPARRMRAAIRMASACRSLDDESHRRRDVTENCACALCCACPGSKALSPPCACSALAASEIGDL